MGKSIARKRKCNFYGNAFAKNVTENSPNLDASETNVPCTTSSSKLEINASIEHESNSICGDRIMNLKILANVINELCCLKCFADNLNLVEGSRSGLYSNFVLKCAACDFCKGFASSKKVDKAPEINMRYVYGMQQIGKDSVSAYKLCATLNLPALARSSYIKIEQKIFTVVKKVADDSMKEAASFVANKNRNVNNEIAECGVSVNGTWQRRGYSSLNGCVAAISIDTGKVIDIEVMSSYCRICKKLKSR